MQLEELNFLLGDEGQKWLAEVEQESLSGIDHLAVAQRLRDQIGPAFAHAVLETVLLRRRAATKFSRASKMYFTRQALQQASSEVISFYRSRRYSDAGFNQVADLGCGIGGDSLALSAITHVTGVDWHPLRLAMAQENVRIYGHGQRFHPLQADLLELTPLGVPALFADPGRRDEQGRRVRSVRQYRPPLSYLDRWREAIPNQGIKISPGVDYGELSTETELEFISVNGEVREGVLWFGDLRTGAGRRATVLPGEKTLIDHEVGRIDVGRPRAYLYEPDGAVIRAHLVEQLAYHLGAIKLDQEIAYLTADLAHESPLATCYRLEDAFPFQLKRLRNYLRQRNIGQVVIKKRGSPLEPEFLRRRLRLQGDEERVLFLTKVMGKATVLIGRTQDTAH
jgi:SAM-dependent methyltransferase